MERGQTLDRCMKEIRSRCDDVVSYQRGRLVSDVLIGFIEKIYHNVSIYEASPLSVDMQPIVKGRTHRELRKYAIGSYSGIGFHMGILPLAIKLKDEETNLKAILMNYHTPFPKTQDSQTEENHDETRIRRPNFEQSQILLFENGVVHLDYLNTETNARSHAQKQT